VSLHPDGMIRYAMQQWDIPLCVSRGQAFRWREWGGGWLGVDAERVMWFRPLADGVEYATLPEPGREDWIRCYFQLDVDLAEVHRAVLQAEPDLAPLVARFPGLRVLRWGSAEECLLSFLCSVNNNIPRISGMIERLCTHLGSSLSLGAWSAPYRDDGDRRTPLPPRGSSGERGLRMRSDLPSPGPTTMPDLHAFPSAATIADLPEEALRGLGFGYRARTLRSAARALCEKPVGWLESLSHRCYEEASRELQSLPGVGRKVADCVCLFGLGFQRAAPVDTHLWQAMCERYFPEWRGLALTERRYEAVTALLAERFGDLAGWAHQYLFYDRLLRRQAVPSAP